MFPQRIVRYVTSQSFMVKAISAGTISNVAVFVFQIVRNKAVAVLAGTEGVGFWGATQSLSNSLISVTTLGIANGIPVTVAEKWRDDQKILVLKSVSATIFAVFGFSLVVGLIALPLSTVLSNAIFGSSAYWWIVVLALIFNPFAASGLVIACALQGMALLRAQTLLWVIGHGVLTIMCVLATYTSGSVGIAFAWLFYGPLSLVLALAVFYRSIGSQSFAEFIYSFRRITKADLKIAVKNLVPFMRAGAVVAVMVSLSSFMIRILILQRMGINALGLFVSVAGISASITTFVQSVLSTYAVPHLTKSHSSVGRLRREVNLVSHAVFLCSFPILLFVSIFAEQILILLFSPDFVSAEKLVRLYLAGEFAQLLSWIFLIYFNVTRRPGKISIAKITEYLVFIFLALLAFPLAGLIGVGIAYLVSGVCAVLVFVLLLPRDILPMIRLIDFLFWVIGLSSLLLIQQGLTLIGAGLGAIVIGVVATHFYRQAKPGGILL